MLKNVLFTIAIIISTATGSYAQSNINLGGVAVDTAAAVEITADSLSVDQDTGTAIFMGSVVIAQGDLRLSADTVDVIYGDEIGQISELVASGNVIFVTETDAAEAQTADYDIANGTLILSGDVLLTQGVSAISADRMTVDVANGTAQMDGRVRTVLQQGNQ